MAIAAFLAAAVLIPPERQRRLLPFTVLAGFALAAAINLTASAVMGLWTFHGVGLLSIRGVPLLALLTWVPVVMLFVHFLPRQPAVRLAWLLLFPLGYTAMEFVFLRLGLRSFAPGWNLFYAFALALATHVVVLSWFLMTSDEAVRPRV